MKETKEETYYRIDDIQRILGLGKTKTYQLVRQPDFPKVKIQGVYLIPKSKFEEFMDSILYQEYELM